MPQPRRPLSLSCCRTGASGCLTPHHQARQAHPRRTRVSRYSSARALAAQGRREGSRADRPYAASGGRGGRTVDGADGMQMQPLRLGDVARSENRQARCCRRRPRRPCERTATLLLSRYHRKTCASPRGASQSGAAPSRWLRVGDGGRRARDAARGGPRSADERCQSGHPPAPGTRHWQATYHRSCHPPQPATRRWPATRRAAVGLAPRAVSSWPCSAGAAAAAPMAPACLDCAPLRRAHRRAAGGALQWGYTTGDARSEPSQHPSVCTAQAPTARRVGRATRPG